MIKWGIRNKILLLALLPSIAISLLMGSYLSYSRLVDLEEFIHDRGVATTQQLGIISQHAIRTNEKRLQQAIANSALEENGIRSITFFDKQQYPLVHAGPLMKPLDSSIEQNLAVFQSSTIIRYSSDTIRFTSPIRTNNLISDARLSMPANSTDNIIGWVEVEFSRDTVSLKKYQTILISAILIIFSLVITSVITLRISHGVIGTIRRLSDSVRQIKNGNYDVDIEIDHGGELRLLSNEVNGMAKAIQSSFTDMQHNVEQTTSDLRETLETIEIQNIELDLARKEAVEASRIKSEFLANTSHEIRTPLNGIIGFTNLLLKTNLTIDQRDYLETIDQSSEGLLTIINDILDFSKIEAGKLVLDHVPVNLRELIEETLTMLAPSAYDKKLELILLIYADIPVHLIGDPLRIKQVLTNLINNAIKFTEHGNIIVRVNLESQKNDQAHLTISITDSGIGLSAQQQRDIFNAFTQADTSTSREFGGTGLGLVISKRLVEQMGGDIGLESEQGKGSTFKFSIKARLADGNQETFPSSLKNKHILLYESNPVLQLSLKYLLESWQIQVHCLDVDSSHQPTKEHLRRIATRYPIDAFVVGITHQQLEKTPTDISDALIEHFDKPVILLAPSSTILPQIHHQNDPRLSVLAKPAPSAKLQKKLQQLILPEEYVLNEGVITQTDRNENLLSIRPKILAVDDNAANLKLLAVLLADMGADVTKACSGLEALNLAQTQRFDLIFMDIQMPEMDGVTTTKHIRALPSEIANTPIVALTAHALAEERQQLLKAGLNDHLTKPINDAQLRQIIHRWCRDQPTTITSITSPSHTVPTSSDDTVEDTVIVDDQHPVDLQRCFQLSNGKPDLARDMLNMLLDKLPEDHSTIQSSYNSGDLRTLLDCVHKLHGACCYTGAPELKRCSQHLETAIKKESTTDIDKWIEQIDTAIHQLQNWAENHDIDTLFFPEEAEIEN